MSDEERRASALLTVPEAAEILRVPDSWLYTAARRGDFPCVRTGRYVRIRESDIRDWITRGGSQAPETPT